MEIKSFTTLVPQYAFCDDKPLDEYQQKYMSDWMRWNLDLLPGNFRCEFGERYNDRFAPGWCNSPRRTIKLTVYIDIPEEWQPLITRMQDIMQRAVGQRHLDSYLDNEITDCEYTDFSKCDVSHLLRDMKPHQPFLWQCGKYGTFLHPMVSDLYPIEHHERYKYLGTHHYCLSEYMGKRVLNEDFEFYHYDGAILQRVTQQQAIDLWDAFADRPVVFNQAI